MCLSIAVHRPDSVLAKGEHAGHEWIVTHNGMGYRCGYVKVNPGHPFHGKGNREDGTDLIEVHGGLTFAEADEDCGKGGPDNGWWFGFDCAHDGDEPDPSLPNCRSWNPMFDVLNLFDGLFAHSLADDSGVRSQGYVEGQCRKLCEQLARVESCLK